MKEKERYIYTKIDGYYWIKDTETNENYCVNKSIVKLLNQQDKRIKELEEENGYIIFSDSYDENGIAIHEQKFVKYKDIFKELVDENKKLKQENKQLKQLQKQH